MLQAAEQQLAVVSDRAVKLETALAGQVDQVKRLKQNRDAAAEHVAHLREQLSAAERRLEAEETAHQDATFLLRSSVEEYAKAQLLRKKYGNTVSELKGFCKTFVAIRGLDQLEHGADLGGITLADDCTVNVPSRDASFVLDGIGAQPTSTSTSNLVDPHSPTADPFNVNAAVSDSLSGYNNAMFSFGAPKTGKTTTMFGNSNGGTPHDPGTHFGVCGQFAAQLFSRLEEHDVTHFNIRCSFGQIRQETIRDLLTDYGGSMFAPSSDLRAVQVQTIDETQSLLRLGLQRATDKSSDRAGGHLFFAFSIENFNRRGHYRKGSMLFVDVSGPQAQDPHTVPSLCNTISMLAAAGDQDPSRLTIPRNTALHRVLSDALGGNCKATMLVTVDPFAVSAGPSTGALPPSQTTFAGNTTFTSTTDDTVQALSYGAQFKQIRNNAVPHDIPAELQKLSLEVEAGASVRR